MRAFVGVDLEPDLRATLMSGSRLVRTEAPGWAAEKWVAEDNLHLTLKFLGDVSPRDVPAFARDLENLLGDVRAFDMRIDRLLAPVPNPRRATMLWTSLNDPDGDCARLATLVDDLAASYEVLPDTRDFVPHITLCRSRRPRALREAAELENRLRDSLTGGRESLFMSVPAVTFFTSELTRKGPHYERVAVIPLG